MARVIMFCSGAVTHECREFANIQDALFWIQQKTFRDSTAKFHLVTGKFFVNPLA